MPGSRSHGTVAAKKRVRKGQIREIVFDDDARREFLTGFHKRKLAKKEVAKAKAIKRVKQERLETRREQRRMLAERAKENAAQVESAYGAILDDYEEKEEWPGIRDAPSARTEEEEYEDEEYLATVMVVEDFDPHTIVHGPPRTAAYCHEPRPSDPQMATTLRPRHFGAPNVKAKAKANIKAKQVRYETKSARSIGKDKQHAMRAEKSERAGGKSFRNPGRRKR